MSPSSYPVNYKGEYHYRSGNTKQQLRGAALTQFIGEKTGLLWDAVPVDNINVADLDQHSLDIFCREAVYNALGHNNYADSVPIQIRIEDDAMYISNNCILPKDWTTETLMKPHKSMPFNPSIANAFYRAGYIEAWGRGIQKICEACQELGTPNPEYTILGNDLTVKFTALKSAKISEFKTPNRQNGGLNGVLEEETQIIYSKILEIIANDSKVTQKEIAQNSGIPLRTVQRAMKELTVRGQIRRQGGKRYGYWEITD